MSIITVLTLSVAYYERMSRRDSRTPDEASHLRGGGDERFIELDAQVGRIVGDFYEAARSEMGLRVQIGVVRGLVSRVELYEGELGTYDRWLGMSTSEVLDRAAAALPIDATTIEDLRQSQDPLVHVIDLLEEVQKADYPEFNEMPGIRSTAERAFDVLLRTVHAP